jgi:hypothetical protein
MSSVNVATTPTQVVPRRTGRTLLLIENVSDTDVFVGFNSDVSAAAGPASGITLRAAGGKLFVAADNLQGRVRAAEYALYAVHAGSGEKELRIQEA